MSIEIYVLYTKFRYSIAAFLRNQKGMQEGGDIEIISLQSLSSAGGQNERKSDFPELGAWVFLCGGKEQVRQ